MADKKSKKNRNKQRKQSQATTAPAVDETQVNQTQAEPEVIETEQLEEHIEVEEYIEQEDDTQESESVEQAVPQKPAPYTITHRTASQPSGSTISDKTKGYSAKALKTAAKPKVWLGVAAIAVAILLSLVLWWQWQRSFVAVVNGQYIPTSKLLSQTLINGGSQALPNLTQQYLIEQEAHARGIVIPQDVIDAELQSIVDDSGGEEGYREALKQYGIPESHIIQQIRTRQILVEITRGNITITDADVQKYYDDNKDTLDPDGSRGFENIKDLVRTELTEQRQEAEFATAVQTLQEKSKVSTYLENANLTRKRD